MADSAGIGGWLRAMLGLDAPMSGGRDSSIPSQAQDPGSLVAPEFSQQANLMPAHLMGQQEANRQALIDAFGQDYLDFEAQAQQATLDGFEFAMQAPITDALVVMSRAYLDAQGGEEEARAAALEAGRAYLGEEAWNYLLPWLERPEARSFSEEVPELGPRVAGLADVLSGLTGVADLAFDAARAARVLGSASMGRAFGDVFDADLGIIVTGRSVRNDPPLQAALQVRQATAPGGTQGFWEDLGSMSNAMTDGRNGVVFNGPIELTLSRSDDLAGVHIGKLTSRGDVDQAAAMRDLLPVLHNADVNGVRVDTVPSAFGHERMPTPQLRNTYNRVGFELTPGQGMVRYPMPTDPVEAAAEQLAREQRYERVLNSATEVGTGQIGGLMPTSDYRELLSGFFPGSNYYDFSYQLRLDAQPVDGGGWDLFLVLPDNTRVPYMPQRAKNFSPEAAFENYKQAFGAAMNARGLGGQVPGLGEFAQRAMATSSDPTEIMQAVKLDVFGALDTVPLEDAAKIATAASEAVGYALRRGLTNLSDSVPLTATPRPSALEVLAQTADSWVGKLSPEDRTALRRVAANARIDEDAVAELIEWTMRQGEGAEMDHLRDFLASSGLGGSEVESMMRRLQRTFGVTPAAPGGQMVLSVPSLTSAEEQVVMNVLNQNTSRMYADLAQAGPGGIGRNQTIARMVEAHERGGRDAVSELIQREYGYDAGHADLVAHSVEGLARELSQAAP